MPAKKSKVKHPNSKARPSVYTAQQKALWRAASRLGMGLEDLRTVAADINVGIRSLSSLSLQQRNTLIGHLNALGAGVRNPVLTNYDLVDEQRLTSNGKVRRFPLVTTKQQQMLDALATQIHWREQDGYLRFCHKQIGAPQPRNQREVTKLRLVLQSVVRQQLDSETPRLPDPQTPRR